MTDTQRTRWWRDPTMSSVAIGLSVLTAAMILMHQLTRPSAVLGIDEYDDGVYFGSSLRLLQGHLPYRSFVFPHPPGMTLLLLPFAVIGRLAGTRMAFGWVRIFTAVVSITSVWLIGRILRHRGPLAVLAGSLSFAVFPLAVTANKSSMLEPYFVFLILVAMAVMFEAGRLVAGRRLFCGAACLGFAAVVKILTAPMLLALILVLAVRHRRDRPRWKNAIVGFVIGAVAPCLPFFVAAPGAFVRQVVLRQLQRGVSSGATSLGNRFVFIGGFRIYPTLRGAAGWSTFIVLMVLVAIVLSHLATRLRFEIDWFLGAALVVSLVSVLAPKDYFTHYSYYTAAFLALAGGAAVGRFVEAGPPSESADRNVRPVLATVVALAILVAGSTGAVRGWKLLDSHPGLQTSGDPGAQIMEIIPAGSCVVTDVIALSITSDRFFADSSCPSVIDPYFSWVDRDPSHPPPANGAKVPDLVKQWEQWFDGADFVVLSRNSFRIPWTSELSIWFNARFERIALIPEAVFGRRT